MATTHTEPVSKSRRGLAHFRIPSNVFLGLLLAVLSWPYGASDLTPVAGLDGGWSSALEIAAVHRLPFGTHLIFTYGPLGFLVVWPWYFSVTAVLSFLFLLVVFTSVFAVLIWLFRQAAPLLLALGAAFFVGSMSISVVALLYTGEPEKSLALVLIACVFILTRPEGARFQKGIWLGLGAALSVFTLVKLSAGVGIAVTLSITLICMKEERIRALKLVLASALPTFAIAWFATGNGFGNLTAFGREAAAIVSGYSPAMSITMPSLRYQDGWALVLVVVLAGVVVIGCWRLPRRSQVGVGLITLLITWQLFEEGFVRQDMYHTPVFFTAVPLLIAAFVPSGRRGLRSALTMCIALAVAVLAGVLTFFPSELTNPGSGAANFASEAKGILYPGHLSTRVHTSRVLLRKAYSVPASMLSRIDGHTVDVDPFKQTVVWAYPKMRFDPLPSVQDYSGYTTSLDQVDTNYISSSSAPRYILREPPIAPDGRNPVFDPPATQIAIECRYRQVESDAAWQLVSRTHDRCGHLRPLGMVTTSFGKTVSVPSARPGEAVVATFDLPLSTWWHVQAEIFKPPSIYVSVDNGERTYRFIPGTASSLHLLVPASTLGYDPEFTPVSIENMSFTIGGQNAGTTGLTVKFYALPMAQFSSP